MYQTTLNPVETTISRLLNKRLRTVIAPTDLTPMQITGIYALIGFGALYFSDVYLPQTIQDPGTLADFQALKGGVEVIFTAGLILLLTTRSRQSIEQQNDRLDTLRAERNLLHRVFRHNLRQDINIISGYSGLIRDGVDDEELLSDCRKVMERIGRIERYQDKIVKIERLLEPTTTLQRMNLSEMVKRNSRVEQLQASDEVSLELNLTDNSEVIAIPYIETAFEEILENAIKHNPSEEPEVAITIEENSDELIDLIVTDNGPGISDYERFALEGMREEDLTHSSGLGLWLAKLACTVSGGNLSIPEQGQGGGKVVLELPVAYEQTIRRRVPAFSG